MNPENRKTKASGLPRMEVRESTEKIRITDDGEAYYGITKKTAIAEAFTAPNRDARLAAPTT